MKNIIVNTNDILLNEITPNTEGVILAYNGDGPRFFIFYDGKCWVASMYIDIRCYSYRKTSLRELVDTLLSLEFITSFKLVEL
jgi:hypothetical protein